MSATPEASPIGFVAPPADVDKVDVASPGPGVQSDVAAGMLGRKDTSQLEVHSI